MCFQNMCFQLQEKHLHAEPWCQQDWLTFSFIWPHLTLRLLGPSWSFVEGTAFCRSSDLQKYTTDFWVNSGPEEFQLDYPVTARNTSSAGLPTGVWGFTFRKLRGLSFHISPTIRCLPQTQVFMVIYRQLRMSASWWRRSDFLEDGISWVPFMPEETPVCCSWIQAAASSLFQAQKNSEPRMKHCTDVLWSDVREDKK